MRLDEALDDPKLFASAFTGSSWAAWRTILRATYALPPRPGDLERFQALTQRKAWPTSPFRECWIVAGRRGGKSRISALIACYTAAFYDHDKHLAPGERAVVAIVAADRAQAGVVFRYVRALFEGSALLRQLVQNETRERIELTNGCDIEVATCSYRTTRGRTFSAVIADECAFWRDETTANPDAAVIAALRPGLVTLPNSLLIGVSSPHARRGLLWDMHKAHFGMDGSDVLVVQAATRSLNPDVPQSIIDRAMEMDPSAASAEFYGLFRSDIEAFLTRETVEAVTVPDRHELPPIEGVRYVAFVDPSGGSSDSMCMAVCHEERRDGARFAVLDCVREVRPPFSPSQVVADFATEMRRYRISECTGDRWGAEFVAEAFRKVGINYKPAERPKSELYRELLGPINSGTVELLDHPKLHAQLVGLERRVARGGRESIDHGPGAHDDLSNVAAGVVHLALGRRRGLTAEMLYGADTSINDDDEPAREMPRGIWRG